MGFDRRSAVLTAILAAYSSSFAAASTVAPAEDEASSFRQAQTVVLGYVFATTTEKRTGTVSEDDGGETAVTYTVTVVDLSIERVLAGSTREGQSIRVEFRDDAGLKLPPASSLYVLPLQSFTTGDRRGFVPVRNLVYPVSSENEVIAFEEFVREARAQNRSVPAPAIPLAPIPEGDAG